MFVHTEWHPPDRRSYSYLLGLYLGDGCISVKARGGAQMAIVCDTAYPDLIEDCWAALILVSMNPRVTRYVPKGQRCVRLLSAWKYWPTAIPQHGPGRHPRAVLRVLRAARDPVDTVEPAQHLDLSPDERRAARLVRPRQVMKQAGARC